jgi:hypothetical protein
VSMPFQLMSQRARLHTHIARQMEFSKETLARVIKRRKTGRLARISPRTAANRLPS